MHQENLLMSWNMLMVADNAPNKAMAPKPAQHHLAAVSEPATKASTDTSTEEDPLQVDHVAIPGEN